jgi:hypothetical protein
MEANLISNTTDYTKNEIDKSIYHSVDVNRMFGKMALESSNKEKSRDGAN